MDEAGSKKIALSQISSAAALQFSGRRLGKIFRNMHRRHKSSGSNRPETALAGPPALSDPFGAKATMLGDLQRAHCLSHRLWRDTDQASESLFQLKEHSYSARYSQRTQGQKNRGRQVVRREQTKTSEQKDQPEN